MEVTDEDKEADAESSEMTDGKADGMAAGRRARTALA